MRISRRIRIATGASVAVLLVWLYGWYDAYGSADKACGRARVGGAADRADTQLREIAAAQGAEVRVTGERTTAIFRWMYSDVAACTYVARGGKIVEVQAGPRALDAADGGRK